MVLSPVVTFVVGGSVVALASHLVEEGEGLLAALVATAPLKEMFTLYVALSIPGNTQAKRSSLQSQTKDNTIGNIAVVLGAAVGWWVSTVKGVPPYLVLVAAVLAWIIPALFLTGILP